MKKLYYEFPTVEVVDFKVEGGFTISGGKAGRFEVDEEDDMDEDLEEV